MVDLRGGDYNWGSLAKATAGDPKKGVKRPAYIAAKFPEPSCMGRPDFMRTQSR